MLTKNNIEGSSYERVELHLHTVFSAMDALTRVNEVIKKAAEYGHPAIAITDYGTVQAFPEAYRAAKKCGIKIIYGMECDCFDDVASGGSLEPFRVILLIKNEVGKRNLYKLFSHYNNQKLCISKSQLQDHREGLLVGTVGYKGELYRAVLNNDYHTDAPTDNLDDIVKFYDYIELLPSINNMNTFGHTLSCQAQHDYNVKIAHIAKSANKPFVAAGNVHFLSANDEICKKVLLSTRGFDMDGIDIPLYFKSTKEILDEFAYLGESDALEATVHNTQMIANCIDDNINPLFDCAFFPSLDGAEENVTHTAISRAEEIYGSPLPELVQKQLSWELDAISTHGFSVLYSIAEQLVKRSIEADYTVGTRGCIAASLVAFLLGITEINPLPPHYICSNCNHSVFTVDGKYDNGFDLPDTVCPKCGTKMSKDGFNLSVETILGLHGDMVPDIDLNFSGEYQALAVQHLKEMFGKERVYCAGTIQTLSERLAFAYAQRYDEDHDCKLSADELVNISEKLAGVKRSDGRHPGGYYIAPANTDIAAYSPICRDGENFITHFSSFEVSGYLQKLDLLGHDMPTLIRELHLATGVSPFDIPLDDPKTLKALVDGDTIGVPEFRSRFIRNMIEKTHPSDISDLIKLSGLSHGTGTWRENAEELIKDGTASLKEVIALRDDVMQFLVRKGMSRSEAHKYMRLIRTGRLSSGYSNEDWVSTFKSFGIDDWYIKSAKRIRYLFPKAHAATYTVQSFKLAWYKTHFANHFYAVLMNHLDADNIFTVSDFEKSPYDIEQELQALLKQASEDYYWSDDYHNKRICALELLMDVYEHQHNFVPLYEHECYNRKSHFQAGINNSIRTTYALSLF